jgi:transcriptional regulator with XRE-family HTH domain
MSNIGQMRIGVKIQLARKGRQITQRQLAARAEIAQGYLSQVESGERTPSDEVVESIQRALGVDFDSDEW